MTGLGLQIKEGWVPVYEGERRTVGTGTNMRTYLPGDAAWSMFRTTKPDLQQKLPRGWKWHWMPIIKR